MTTTPARRLLAARRAGRTAPLLVLATAVALALPGCDRDVTRPPSPEQAAGEAGEAGAPDYASMTDRELMIATLQRMDRLEARVEREVAAAQAQLDGFLAGDVGTVLARADRERSRGTEQCLEISVGSEAELESLLKVLGNAFAGVGAWAGTGGTANLKGVAAIRAKFDPAKAQVAVKKTWCFGRGATRDPFVGNTVAGDGGASAAPAEPQALEAELAAVVDRLGLDEDRARRALTQIGNLASGTPPCRPGDCARAMADALPIPPDFRAILDDPRGFIRDRGADYADFASDQLCAGLFPGAFGTRLEQACALRDRVPDTEQLLATYDALDGLPGLVARIDDRLSIVCARAADLIDGVNGFSIEKHAIFRNDILWPGPQVPLLGTDCVVLRNG